MALSLRAAQTSLFRSQVLSQAFKPPRLPQPAYFPRSVFCPSPKPALLSSKVTPEFLSLGANKCTVTMYRVFPHQHDVQEMLVTREGAANACEQICKYLGAHEASDKELVSYLLWDNRFDLFELNKGAGTTKVVQFSRHQNVFLNLPLTLQTLKAPNPPCKVQVYENTHSGEICTEWKFEENHPAEYGADFTAFLNSSFIRLTQNNRETILKRVLTKIDLRNA